MTGKNTPRYEGACTCGAVQYRLHDRPLCVHCCHCSWCQRETGSAFAVNALIESDRLSLLRGEVEKIETPSASGKGQLIVRCAHCRVALWSHYAGLGDVMSFVRVGTLKEPGRLPPDVHIFTSTKLPWVLLPKQTPAFTEYYDRNAVWTADALARRQALLGKNT